MSRSFSRRGRLVIVPLAMLMLTVLADPGLAGDDCTHRWDPQLRGYQVEGTSGADVCYGSDVYPDVFTMKGGNDTAYGYGGGDSFYMGGAGDTAHGGAGNDWLYGQGGSDTLYGNAGNDYLNGGGGAYTRDWMYGGDGSDMADDPGHGGGLPETDIFYGGNGRDDGMILDDNTDSDDFWYGQGGDDVCALGDVTDYISTGPDEDLYDRLFCGGTS